LRDSAYPEQREWAAERLAVVSPHQYPQVLQTVLKAAREDPTAMVQVACIRSLVAMGGHGQDVTAVLETLKHAGDPRVRFEADQALTRLGGPSGAPSSAVLPASYENRGTR